MCFSYTKFMCVGRIFLLDFREKFYTIICSYNNVTTLIIIIIILLFTINHFLVPTSIVYIKYTIDFFHFIFNPHNIVIMRVQIYHGFPSNTFINKQDDDYIHYQCFIYNVQVI